MSWGGPPGYGQPNQFQQQQFHQPPPHFQPPPPMRVHVGLGAPGAAPNLPPPPNLQQQPYTHPNLSSVPAGERWTMFVGSIADVDNGWLERILGVAGTVLSLRRPTPAFAFVEYGDPEAVLRCLQVVNSAIIPPKAGGEGKAILVKADDKTRARLDTYEASRVKDDQTATEYLLQAKDELAAIIKLMKTGAPPATSTLAAGDTPHPHPRPELRGATYLQDLAPEDLREDKREVITSEIAMFRERAAKKAAEKKAADEIRRQGHLQSAQQRSMGNNTPANGNAWGQRGSPAQDPQSYNKPIGFVGAAGGSSASPSTNRGASAAQSPTISQSPSRSEPSAPPVFNDEERERERVARERREAEAMFRDAERRLENRERSRIAAVERERQRERGIQDQESRERGTARERLALYDDDREMDTGREPFYEDRIRWRTQRRAFRAREAEADQRDREAEVQQLAALQKQSEDFLSQQADMFAKITGAKGKGALPDDEPLVKLSFGAAVAPKPAPKAAVPSKAAILGAGDDEDDGKKKRTLIPLTYDGIVDETPTKPGHRLTAAERERKARDVLERIPVTKESLWAHKMAWSALTETLVRTKISPLASKTIVSYLGDEEEELLNAVLDHVRAHKGAAELVEELEPVLDEDATEFVRKIWKELAYELALAQALGQ